MTRNVDTDPVRRALVVSLVAFAGSLGATLVAEGVETVSEVLALRGLGVGLVQGFKVARPRPLPLPRTYAL